MSSSEEPRFDPQLAALGVEGSVPSGAWLWREGDAGDHVALLLEGILEVVQDGPEGEIVVRTLESGAVVGELAASQGRSRSASVRARTPCRILKVASTSFRDLLRARPDVLEQLYWMQVERVRSLTRRVVRSQRRVYNDPATGLLAAGFLQERLEEEAQRARRTGDYLSLVMLQPDPWPGDRETALATLARVARRRSRRADIVARWGRDTVALLLYGAAGINAVRVAEGIREEIEATSAADDVRGLTVSAGVASLPADATDAEGLLKSADMSLWAAREQGGNRVVGTSEPVTPQGAIVPIPEDDATELARSFRAVTDGRRSTISRAFLDNILRSMADTVIVTDGDGRIVLANEAAARLLAYEDEVELRGRHMASVCPEGWEMLKSWGGGAVEGISFIRDVETTYRTRDGRAVPVSFAGSVMRDAHGMLQGVVCDAQDSTDRLRSREELRLAKDAAEQASQAKSTFLANMSHELRTPLNAIIGYTEMLLEEIGQAGPDHVNEDLHRVHGSARHLLGLINDILDLSKIEAGRMEIHAEDVNLPELLREVLATVRPLADKRGNVLEVRCAEGVVSLHTDAMKLRQSLLNLLSNASKFTEDGEVVLKVEPEERSGVAGLAFRVQDTGIGMNPTQMDRLFQPFTQADPSTTRKYGGTGLGLAITRRFAEMLGGTIGAQSEPGRGTTFTLWLPTTYAGPPARAH
jgi:diguanylate cyclase (GGDEF)-like protein/PAS domain S-box-containing protein